MERRDLPSVDELARDERLAGEPPALAVEAARTALAHAREEIRAGHDPGDLGERALRELAAARTPSLRRALNATGVIVHTNLGRAPLPEAALERALEIGRGYSNLEYDLSAGARGSRQDHVAAILRRLTGAEGALVVNNNAAAVMLALAALAEGREVLVSRGELIEIGDGFRIPEVLARSGARLREVGTTNRTRAADYERAVGPGTAALMRVHTSNYRVRGFTKAVDLPQLVELGRKHNLTVIDDAGSGQAIDLTPFGLPGEPLVSVGIAAGADLVLFSGDKLLGGPQAGIIAGRAALVQRIEKDPLMRAFRLDKMTLAALEATLRLYRDPARALRDIPALRMLTVPLTELRQRAEAFAVKLRQVSGIASAEVRQDVAYVGGGSLPDVGVPTAVVAVTAAGVSEAELSSRLRRGSPAVVGRVQDGKLLLDLRTVFERQEEELLAALQAAVG